ncbi:hypothetical protein BGZ60DRAFT_555032, partial [Tricladium varicosporioides]
KVISRSTAFVASPRENNRTKQFRALPCLGYLLSESTREVFRFGLVFKNPVSVDPIAKPVSLHDLLRDEKSKVPSLTARVAMSRAIAECVEKLNAVNWLHKGLRSDNILFFRTDKVDCDLFRPYISGFEYSRPAQRHDITERPSGDVFHNLYRHPQVQGMVRDAPRIKGYKKIHDIYSLGIVLLEIVYWRTINSILGFKALNEIRPSETAKFRGKLLNGEYLNYVQSYLGDTVHGIIHSCLMGVTFFGIQEEADETNVFVGAKLQGQFYNLVIQKLQDIKI